eukprot:gnl/MRDRNA2_/MRDRNA2_70325_c0_seq4.p1 gnl/MRDRNA2_/MRDRNA2_70325_c0~~gnl/MRDRNA2_/MRDRNA2_70325_c0_seq4.p1  ORF type:complete len:346 (-),score=48.75 gnl/MRDRNA2_/MRDRNA2_70325_c0_seq4:411-1448(-)
MHRDIRAALSRSRSCVTSFGTRSVQGKLAMRQGSNTMLPNMVDLEVDQNIVEDLNWDALSSIQSQFATTAPIRPETLYMKRRRKTLPASVVAGDITDLKSKKQSFQALLATSATTSVPLKKAGHQNAMWKSRSSCPDSLSAITNTDHLDFGRALDALGMRPRTEHGVQASHGFHRTEVQSSLQSSLEVREFIDELGTATGLASHTAKDLPARRRSCPSKNLPKALKLAWCEGWKPRADELVTPRMNKTCMHFAESESCAICKSNPRGPVVVRNLEFLGQVCTVELLQKARPDLHLLKKFKGLHLSLEQINLKNPETHLSLLHHFASEDEAELVAWALIMNLTATS